MCSLVTSSGSKTNVFLVVFPGSQDLLLDLFEIYITVTENHLRTHVEVLWIIFLKASGTLSQVIQCCLYFWHICRVAGVAA